MSLQRVLLVTKILDTSYSDVENFLTVNSLVYPTVFVDSFRWRCRVFFSFETSTEIQAPKKDDVVSLKRIG